LFHKLTVKICGVATVGAVGASSGVTIRLSQGRQNLAEGGPRATVRGELANTQKKVKK